MTSVKKKNRDIETFSGRLRSERKRLKYIQREFAALCGVTPQAQIRYEGEEPPAFAVYLQRAAAFGVDVGYLVTGQRAGDAPPASPEERAMLAAWRNAPPALREAALAVLACGGAAANKQGGVAVATGHGHAVALGNGAKVNSGVIIMGGGNTVEK